MRKLFFLILMTFVFIISVLQVYAAPAVNFSVKAEIPDNQVDSSKTYFDLRIAPGERQTICVQIVNNGQEPIISSATLNPATTGQNGIILYNESPAQMPNKYISILDVARIETPQIHIEPNSTAIAEISIAMPEQPIEGALLGGLVFTAEKAESDISQESDTGISFQNEIEYIIALKITQDEADISPDFTFVGVEAGQANHRTAVLATIENISPVILKGMNIRGEIYRENSSTPFREVSLLNVEAAPSSSFPIVFDWQNVRIESGEYRIKLNVEYKGEEWNFDNVFTISSQQAGVSNQNAVNIRSSNNNRGWMFAVIIILVVVLAYFVWDKFKKR